MVKSMWIVVQILLGKRFVLDVEKSDTLTDIKAKISAQRFPSDSYDLMFNGEELKFFGKRSLLDYGITDGSTIELRWHQPTDENDETDEEIFRIYVRKMSFPKDFFKRHKESSCSSVFSVSNDFLSNYVDPTYNYEGVGQQYNGSIDAKYCLEAPRGSNVLMNSGTSFNRSSFNMTSLNDDSGNFEFSKSSAGGDSVSTKEKEKEKTVSSDKLDRAINYPGFGDTYKSQFENKENVTEVDGGNNKDMYADNSFNNVTIDIDDNESERSSDSVMFTPSSVKQNFKNVGYSTLDYSVFTTSDSPLNGTITLGDTPVLPDTPGFRKRVQQPTDSTPKNAFNSRKVNRGERSEPFLDEKSFGSKEHPIDVNCGLSIPATTVDISDGERSSESDDELCSRPWNSPMIRSIRCYCKTGCTRSNCTCYKNKVNCNINCHSGLDCYNGFD